MLELHCHTTFSDGTLTPTELVDAAVNAGVKALAITDHDTVSGWDEALNAAPAALEIVPGLELSTVYNERSLHILGFYPDRERLILPLAERLEGRKRRAQTIVKKLADLGYPLELSEMGEGMAAGRPHIASLMVKAGYVESAREAFDRFLADDKPAFVQYEKFGTADGIELLRSCGAVSVWAHPYLFRGGVVETMLPELVEAGLMGIEVYHPSHTLYQVDKLKNLCAKYNLLMTGGSDYHGPSRETKRDEYCGLNRLQVPLELLEPIKMAAVRSSEALHSKSQATIPSGVLS
ncbi:PHP domain-containing protein [Myxacorys almedinensis]|uniref:PHP domain-containing protein n=1 Tax=Myxacorys almedinensis A TaxID=2690445 RepID=A0A8J7Z2K6_9CYAN|nr:PHP domain-containing protein [Myxacorys almedinensis]NDJ18130.1 PHP domain-containing protein [Myxacorys almedinensis A]